MDTLRALLATTIFLVGLLLLGSIFLGGCSATPQCVKPVVELQRPDLPKASAADLQCLKPSAYAALAVRDAACIGYAKELETIIRELAEVPE